MSVEVTVNGNSRSLESSTTLGKVVEAEVGEDADHVAASVNGAIVPRSEWTSTTLEADDEVEIVRPIQGGSGVIPCLGNLKTRAQER